MRSLVASLLAVISTALAAPAQAFQITRLDDGSYEYFFATPSLRVQSTGDLDLAGLAFIEGVTDGFRVGASFSLDWLDGEQAWLAPAQATWSGFDSAPRGIEILVGGNLHLGSTRLTLIGGNILLAAGGILDIGTGTLVDLGNGIVDIGGNPGIIRPPVVHPFVPPDRITLAVPEPSTWVLLVAGLLVLTAASRRKSAL
jgi:hypothetical protein